MLCYATHCCAGLHHAVQQAVLCMVQGDMEKAVGLPVSALMDRSMKGGMTRSQVQFPMPLKLFLCHLFCSQLCSR